VRRWVSVAVIALLLSSLLCACAAGRPARPAAWSLASRSSVTGRGTVVAYVQGFHRSYVAAHKVSLPAAEAVVRSHVAAWYYPILEVPDLAGVDPIECGLSGPVAGWSFEQAEVLAGQAVIVIGSRPPGAPQELWIVATAVSGTGKITGITCSIGGQDVTSADARETATPGTRHT